MKCAEFACMQGTCLCSGAIMQAKGAKPVIKLLHQQTQCCHLLLSFATPTRGQCMQPA